jgi:hypothetical protein
MNKKTPVPAAGSQYLEKDSNKVTVQFRNKFPDLFQAVYNEGFSAGRDSINIGEVDHEEMKSFIENNTIGSISKNMSLEDRIEAEWAANPATRQEFNNDFAAFSAAERAFAQGRVKIIGGKI